MPGSFTTDEVQEADLVQLVGQFGAGYVAVAKFHAAYASRMREDGRPPLSMSKLGRVLSRAGWRAQTRHVGDGVLARAWTIDNHMVLAANRKLGRRDVYQGYKLEPGWAQPLDHDDDDPFTSLEEQGDGIDNSEIIERHRWAIESEQEWEDRLSDPDDDPDFMSREEHERQGAED